MAPSLRRNTYNSNSTSSFKSYTVSAYPPALANLDSSFSTSGVPSLDTASATRPHNFSSDQSVYLPDPRREEPFQMMGPTSEEEFDALPITVRRKYFSTLERLRLARDSDPIASNAHDKSPVQRKSSLLDRTGARLSRQSSINGRLQKPNRPRGRSSVSSADVSWLLTLPDKLRRREYNIEGQEAVCRSRRNSVILDAADEAIYKPSRRANRALTTMLVSPTIASPTESMDFVENNGKNSRPSSLTKAMYDSFRWMDDENDLDLRLALDDYHANLDGAVLPKTGSTRRPSFRRHMSITKIPFGRASLSNLNRNSQIFPVQQTHVRRKSRAFSMMQPRHAPSASVVSIDPGATHYQDPEARLKLRVYLASPQKFDEAIEFGFPSRDGISTVSSKENRRALRLPVEVGPSKTTSPEVSQTFLVDDSASLSDGDATMLDPDSPRTPSDPAGIFKNPYVGLPPFSNDSRASETWSPVTGGKPIVHKHTESYAQSIAGSREMTLRMTLTRPDLRADDSMLYGWQSVAPNSPPGIEAADPMELASSGNVKGPFGGVDGWGPVDKDDGVVKRIWNRMRNTQRRIS